MIRVGDVGFDVRWMKHLIKQFALIISCVNVLFVFTFSNKDSFHNFERQSDVHFHLVML